MVVLVLLGAQAGFDIPQAFAVGQLSEGHTEIMVVTGKLLDLEAAIVSLYASVKYMERKMFHHLRKNEFSRERSRTPRAILHEDLYVSEKF